MLSERKLGGRTHLVVCKCKDMSTFKEERGETRRIVHRHRKHHDWLWQNDFEVDCASE